MTSNFPRLINLSLPKTGSTTIGQVFAPVGGVHEGLHDLTVSFILDYREGLISRQQLLTLLTRRQRKIKAEIDSSTFLHLIAPELYEFLPESTLYIQILREPATWVESYLNMLVGVGEQLTGSPVHADLAWTSRYGKYHSSTLEPLTLYYMYTNKEYVAPIVSDLLLFWQRSVTAVQEAIPPNQLLCSSLDHLAISIPALAEHINVPLDRLNLKASVSNVGSKNPRVRDVISRHVSDAINTYSDLYASTSKIYNRITRYSDTNI